MKTTLLATLIAALPGAALAHPGHVVEAGGHTHWVALVILGGLGLALAVWGLAQLARSIKRRSKA